MADQEEVQEGQLEGEALHREAADCARYGEVEDLRRAVAAGADVNWRGAGGNTALHMVSAPCATCNVRCARGDTPKHLHAASSH